jgi:hypothetical protein
VSCVGCGSAQAIGLISRNLVCQSVKKFQLCDCNPFLSWGRAYLTGILTCVFVALANLN